MCISWIASKIQTPDNQNFE